MRRTSRWLLAAMTTVAVLSGCGDGADPAGSPSSTAASPSGSASSDEPGPTDEPSGTVEPATGTQKTLGSMTVTFPEGYEIEKPMGLLLIASGPDGARINLTAVDAPGWSLRKQARYELDDSDWTGRPTREADVEVDGWTMFHVTGRALGGRYSKDVFGAEYGDSLMFLEFELPGARRERQDTIDSVLATVSWTS